MYKDNNEKALIVECDGVEDKSSSYTSPVLKQTILARCGFEILRISFREWHYSSNACVERVRHFFDEE